MGKEYAPLGQDDLNNGDVELQRQSSSRRGVPWNTTFIVVLLLTNLLALVKIYMPRDQEMIPKEFPKSDPLKTTYTRFDWWTEYSSSNRSTSDALWDAIQPSHGFVAMERQWAAARDWPATMGLPDDPARGVYLLEAYHELHCLRMLRTTFWEAVEGRAYTYGPTPHMEHCFDTLRQAVICNADSTPLYTFGDNTAGVGQLHRCRSWDELRHFATENSACYRDTIDDVLLREHFGYCDDGSDGLVWHETVLEDE